MTSGRSQAANARLEAIRRADRPRAHTGDSHTEVAIFEATERLLGHVRLQDLSVAQIVERAGVSRATFYFYFSSKYAVVAGLLARVMDDIYSVMQPFVRRTEDSRAEDVLRESLQAAARVWALHRALLRGVMENWHAVPELQKL